MDPASIAAIVVGAVSLIGSLVSTGVNAHQQNKTNQQSMDFARESAETAQKNTKELMDYNSPSYQMGRIVSAGLNPNLAYENLDTPIPTGAQPSQPSLKAPHLDFNSGLNDALAAAQINRLNVAADNESAETDAKVKLMYKDLPLKDAEIDLLHEQAKAMSQSIAESKSRINLMSEQQRSAFLDNLFKDATMQDRYRTVAAERGISEKQAQFEEKYIAAKILNLNDQAKFYRAQAALSYKQQTIVDELVKLYQEQTRGFGIENDINDLTKRGLNVKYGDTDIPVGVLASYQDANKRVSSAAIVEIQRQLIQKFGATKEVIAIIESVSRTINNVSEAGSYWVPTRSKTVEYGNIKKGITGHFIGQ